MNRSEKTPKRLFVDDPLEGGRLTLDADQARYLGRVLRCREGDSVIVFNTRGRERSAAIESLGRRRPTLLLGPVLTPLPEPDIPIVLLQALVKSDAMDLIVQKATELGATAVLAARTEFSVVKLDGERKARRLDHWRRVAASACEQSGRHRPPTLEIFDSLAAATAAVPPDCKRIAFHTGAGGTWHELPVTTAGVCLAIGPEGGFSRVDTRELEIAGFGSGTLGPRTLRAETAAIAAMACAQLLHGDLV